MIHLLHTFIIAPICLWSFKSLLCIVTQHPFKKVFENTPQWTKVKRKQCDYDCLLREKKIASATHCYNWSNLSVVIQIKDWPLTFVLICTVAGQLKH